MRRSSRIIGVLCIALMVWLSCTSRTAEAAEPAGDVSSLIRSAQHDFEVGNYLGSIKTLQSAVLESSANAEAYFWLSRSYLELRDYDNAVIHAEKAVSLDSKSSAYHQWLGRAYGGKADHDRSFFLAKKVKKELQEAIRLNPSNIEARIDLEDFLLNAPWIVGGSKDEARDQADTIAAIDPVQGHVARGKYDFDGLKRPDLADAEYRQILTSKSKDIQPYLEAIAFFQKESKLSDMESGIEEAQNAIGRDPRLEFFQAVQWILSGTESSQAEEYLKSYLASTPERSDWPPHAAAREWLGRVYESQGKTAEAAEQYRIALNLDPNRKEVQSRLQKLGKASQ